MTTDALFLIYGKVNDEFVALARRLRPGEVTARAREIRKKTGHEVLILEDRGDAPSKTRGAGKKDGMSIAEKVKASLMVKRTAG